MGCYLVDVVAHFRNAFFRLMGLRVVEAPSTAAIIPSSGVPVSVGEVLRAVFTGMVLANVVA